MAYPNLIQDIYFFLAMTLPYWFPFVMLAIGKSLISKIKNPDIRLAIFIPYMIFCVIFFLIGVNGL